MNLNSLTQINYNDPLPKLGKKIVKNEVQAKPIASWKNSISNPGIEINSLTGQMRTNFKENEKASTISSVPVTKKPAQEFFDLSLVASRGIPIGTIQASTIQATGLTIKSVCNSKEDILKAFEKFGWRSDKPSVPGLYIAFTYGALNISVLQRQGHFKHYSKTWDGTNWKFNDGTGADLPVLWYDASYDQSLFIDSQNLKDKLDLFEISGTDGWRNDVPNVPGIYYATNLDSIDRINERGFEFIRKWDGKNWFRRPQDVERGKFENTKFIKWHKKPVSEYDRIKAGF